MDTTDRNDSHLPARFPSSSSHLPATSPSYRPSYELATTTPAVQISPQGVLRGLARNWWRILLLWGAVSAPLVFLLYTQVEPTYQPAALIRAEPTRHGLFTESSDNTQAMERHIETQIRTILSDRVLEPAIAEVAYLPVIKNSSSPLTDVKENLKVKNINKTSYIEVSFESNNADEAANLVNAVVQSYLQSHRIYEDANDDKLKGRLKSYLEELEAKKEKYEAELLRIVSQNLVDNIPGKGASDPEASGDEPKKGDPPSTSTKPTFRDVSIEQYSDYKKRILDKEYEIKLLEYALQSRTADPGDQSEADTDEGLQSEQLEAQINDLFRSDPSVAALIQDILATDDELNHTKSVARHSHDPARKAAAQQKEKLEAKYNDLWKERYAELRQQVIAAHAAAGGSGPVSPNALTSDQLKARLEMSRHELASLNEMLQSMDVETKTTQSQTYQAEKLNADIAILRSRCDMIFKKLEDVKFTTDKDLVRIDLIDPAKVLKSPTNEKRIKYMIAAPAAILCMVLGLFALLEVKAERVADPDMLSTRVQSEVFSLPPLPLVRASSNKSLNAPGTDDQIDRFVQRLDHLRFAICGDHPEVGLGRCVLITSAIGGEGKTTLAAQLAARCGNAGHSTLLIDADLRRGALCPLLDVPEGLGLSDVLNEKANVEDVVIPVQQGTFHLLCAGTPIGDASRVFQGRNFGMLIARLRQMYDLIIIDSPPVLPVPDGLIMGRWTDGAVLTSRYDVSRAPQVERARRQLNNAGIPVLGTVINGMKSSDAYYGRYSYSRGRSGFAEPDESPTT